ncbi:hypothetical protein ACQP2C_02460 [Micromonospora zamorensis]|uniref:hypothetical protein n=1 Tax=Micromonospora zamorensis TaxID=709883 RepID=UPI003D96A134
MSFDAWPPEPQLVRGVDGEIRELLGLSYPCTAFDKWQVIPVVRGETVVDFVRTYF